MEDLLLEYLPHTGCGCLLLLVYLVAVRRGWISPVQFTKRTKKGK